MGDYYLVTTAPYQEITGTIPQIQSIRSRVPIGRQYIPPSSFRNKTISKNYKPEDVKLEKGAKITSCLRGAAYTFPYQLVIDEAFLKLLEQWKGAPFDYTPLNVYDNKGICHQYYFLNYLEPASSDLINWEKSSFKAYDPAVYGYVPAGPVHSLSEYKRADIIFDKIVLNVDLLEDWHHFTVPVTMLWLITGSFFEAIKEANITGISVYRYDRGHDISTDPNPGRERPLYPEVKRKKFKY